MFKTTTRAADPADDIGEQLGTEPLNLQPNEPVNSPGGDPEAWKKLADTPPDLLDLSGPVMAWRRALWTSVEGIVNVGENPTIDSVRKMDPIERTIPEGVQAFQAAALAAPEGNFAGANFVAQMSGSVESAQAVVDVGYQGPIETTTDTHVGYRNGASESVMTETASRAIPSALNKNSFVTTVMTEAAREFDDMNTRLQAGNLLRSTDLTAEYCDRSEKLKELKKAGPERAGEAAELRKELTYDWIIEGKGHGGIVAALTALKEDPGAKIAIVGQDSNFWTRMGFSIAVVGNLHGFLNELGGAVGRNLMQDAVLQDHLERHNGQMCGAFLGRWIEETLKDFMDSGSITVLNGRVKVPAEVEPGGARALTVEVTEGKQTRELTLFGSHPSAIVSPIGLGPPIDMKFLDAGSGERISSRAVTDKLNGFPISYDNFSYQLDLAERVRDESKIRDHGKDNFQQPEREHVMQAMIKRDIAMAKERGMSEVAYVFSGNGDGSFSVLEGVLEGLGRDVRKRFEQTYQREPTKGEFADALSESLGPIKFVWAGKNGPTNGWYASQDVRRYALIAEYIDILEQEGKLSKVDERLANVTYDPSNPAAAFKVTTSESREKGAPPGELDNYPATRIFNSIGYQGADPLLQSVYQYDHPTAKKGEIPSGDALKRAVNVQPIYDGNDPPRDVVGMAILNRDGEVLKTLPGTAMYVLAIGIANAYKDVEPDPSSGFFLHDPGKLRQFKEVVAGMNERMLTLQSLHEKKIMLDYNPNAEIKSPLHQTDDYRNPAGVYYGGVLTDELMRTLARERRFLAHADPE